MQSTLRLTLIALCVCAMPARAFEDLPDPTAIRLTPRAERGIAAPGSVEARDRRFRELARTGNDAPRLDRDRALVDEAALLVAIERGDQAAVDAQWQALGADAAGLAAAHEGLVAAAYAGRKELVRRFLARGADADHLARRGAAAGLTPLAAAVLRDDPLLAHSLLQAGADPDRRAGNGKTPLVLAIELGRERVARELLEGGADPRLESHGQRALALAALWGRTRLIDWLTRMGEDPNEPDARGQAPLQLAMAEQQVGAVRALLRVGADPARIGMTPDLVLLAVGAEPAGPVAQ